MAILWGHELTTDREIIEHERLLFSEFYQRTPSGWIARNYKLVDKNRLRSIIPYSSQKIFCIKEGDVIVSTVAVNFDVDKILQLVEMGFELNYGLKRHGFCEGLTFFITRRKRYHYRTIFREVYDLISTEMKQRNIKTLFATCYLNALSFYIRNGCWVIQEKRINEKKKFLLGLSF